VLLSKELSEKNDSIVVLESRCRALCEEEARTEELKVLYYSTGTYLPIL